MKAVNEYTDLGFIDLNLVFDELVKYKRYILGFTLFLVVLVEAVCFWAKPVYRADSNIFLPALNKETASTCRGLVEDRKFPGLYRVRYAVGKRMINMKFQAETAEKAHELTIAGTKAAVNDINAVLQKDKTVNHERAQLNAIKKELDNLKKNNLNNEALLQKLNALKGRVDTADKKLALNQVRVFLPVNVPDKPAYPQPVKYGCFAIALGLLGSLAVILIRATSKNAIKNR